MIELNSLLGAELFTIYRQYPGKEVNDILEYYDKRGRLNYVPWNFPSKKVMNNVMCQRASLNDCLYKNMHLYDYVIVTDLDEVFVPRIHENWTQLMGKCIYYNRPKKYWHNIIAYLAVLHRPTSNTYFKRHYTLILFMHSFVTTIFHL